MKKRTVVIITLLGVIALVIGIVIFSINKVVFNNSNLEIIDATYHCNQGTEKFYEDGKYTYSFRCANSSASVYVKFENGNKMLVVDALEEGMVTIDELLDAGLEVYKKEK